MNEHGTAIQNLCTEEFKCTVQTQDIYTFALGIKDIKNVYGTLIGKLKNPSILKSKRT
jgi:hypothetical protein